MPLRIGIVGLPNVGKSTLFNALTRTRAANASNYPFCTIDPNIGVVEVPDERLEKISEIAKPAKVVPATVEFVDIAGLVRGAHKGEGLGNQFLHHIREMDAICLVTRFFKGEEVLHVEGSIDPKRDRETVEAELILKDLETVASRIEKIRNAAHTGEKEKQRELAVLEKLAGVLNGGAFAANALLSEEEEKIVRPLALLTRKPILHAANVGEEDLKTSSQEELHLALGLEGIDVIGVSAKVEEDLQELPQHEAYEYLRTLGATSSGLDQLIQAAYKLLGYITFFTAGPKEARAWNIVQGTKAPEAAATIHTDMQRGFICAEVIAFEDYVALGGEQGAKAAGKMRTEGKEYAIHDGDIVHIRFNV